jgi:hypothetical protein
MASAANRAYQECADGVDRDDAPPAFGIGPEEFDPSPLVPGRGRHADAGAIDQDIECAESPEHVLNGMPAICGLGHIGDGIEEFSGKRWFGGEAIATSTPATLAPAPASARAITRPMPFAAPVTMATRPASTCACAMTRCLPRKP